MTQIYLRPSGFVESPQRHDGESLRLAGTMLWFSQIEYIERAATFTHRRLIAVHEWTGFTATLSHAHRERCALLLANITSPRAALHMGARTIRFDQPHVMGIINATPDSFSDGGKNFEPEVAVEAAFAMSFAGAAIIDVGGESTRPGAALVWERDELAPVEPVIRRLAGAGIAISIDTRKALVMEGAVQAGAFMINDISALLYDDRALDVARGSDVPIVMMHAPSQSSDPHKDGIYKDVVYDVFDWLEQRITAVEAVGISRDKILVDPGIGFGKSITTLSGGQIIHYADKYIMFYIFGSQTNVLHSKIPSQQIQKKLIMILVNSTFNMIFLIHFINLRFLVILLTIV